MFFFSNEDIPDPDIDMQSPSAGSPLQSPAGSPLQSAAGSPLQSPPAGSPLQQSPEGIPSFQSHREKFLEYLDKAEQKWDTNEQFRKAWCYMEKQMGTALNGNENTLCRKLFGFGHERKKKNSQEIPIGSQHIARRRFQHRGRYAAPAGRRPKPAADQPERFVVDDEEVTLRPPPKKKAREQKRGHDLMASVAQNKPGSKKH